MGRTVFAPEQIAAVIDRGPVKGMTRVWSVDDWTLIVAVELPRPKWQMNEQGDFILTAGGERIAALSKSGEQLRTCAKLIVDEETGEWFGLLPDLFDRLSQPGGPFEGIADGMDITDRRLVFTGAWSEPSEGSTLRSFVPGKWKLARV